jgi:hypothetical protein
LQSNKVHGHGELISAELTIRVNIGKIPNLCEGFFGKLSLHEEVNCLFSSDQTELGCVNCFEDAIELGLLRWGDQPITSSDLSRKRSSEVLSTGWV